MKAGKNPTRRQKIFLRSLRLNPDNWFVTKDTPDELHLVHRLSVEDNEFALRDKPNFWGGSLYVSDNSYFRLFSNKSQDFSLNAEQNKGGTTCF